MGAWGERAIDNDAAADWFIPIGKYLADQVEYVFSWPTADNEEEVRAACYLLEQIGETYIWDVERLGLQLARGIDMLREILASDWINTWKDPEAVRSAIQVQIANLERRQNKS